MKSVLVLVLLCYCGTAVITENGVLQGSTLDGVSVKCNGTPGCSAYDGNQSKTEPSKRTWNHSDVTTLACRQSRRDRGSALEYRKLRQALQKTLLDDAYDEHGLDALRHQLELKGLEQRLFLHKGGSIIVALILIKLKLIAVGILLVLLGIKKFIIIVALFGPLMKKFRFSGHYVTDINYPPLPVDADEEDHAHHPAHDHTKYYWPPYNPHGHPKHLGAGDNNEPPYNPHDHMKQYGPPFNTQDYMKQHIDSHGPPFSKTKYMKHHSDSPETQFNPFDNMKQHGNNHGPPISPHDYMKQNGDSPGPPLNLYDFMKQHGDSHGPQFNLIDYMKQHGDSPGPPLNLYDYLKQHGNSQGPPYAPPNYMKQHGADGNHGFPSNPQDYSKQYGVSNDFGPVYKPRDSTKQNGASGDHGPVYKSHDSSKQNDVLDSYGRPYASQDTLQQLQTSTARIRQ